MDDQEGCRGLTINLHACYIWDQISNILMTHITGINFLTSQQWFPLVLVYVIAEMILILNLVLKDIQDTIIKACQTLQVSSYISFFAINFQTPFKRLIYELSCHRNEPAFTSSSTKLCFKTWGYLRDTQKLIWAILEHLSINVYLLLKFFHIVELHKHLLVLR